MTISPQTLWRLKFKHLRLIDILARTGNFHRAAEELNLTQPAATKILQDVEDILGLLIFDRSTRPMSISDIGEHVVDYARRTLAEGDRFTDSLNNLRRGGFGALSIGAILATSTDLLPQALAELKRRRPLMTIQIKAATSDILADALLRGELDVVLGRSPDDFNGSRFEFTPIGIEQLWAFVSASHPLAFRENVDYFSQHDFTWVLQPKPSPLRALINRVAIGHGLPAFDNVVETTSVSVMLQLVRHANMVAVLPHTLVKREIENGDFVRLPIQLDNQLPPHGILIRKGEVLSANALEFIAIVKSLAAGISA
ncbi:LysR family transcriptional regulator [Caballeronia insecticola]|uniref:Transcriptional regulator LysR family n=1 Tax=Caballeronia insecticola TaxID=758793 RepID=R4WZ30_9BURK|nr:LysR family transcriptional regulator [Caballeronia insecticola]BAN26880.1 transcriptional regulator LysR family [Caballeronia insecticola]